MNSIEHILGKDFLQRFKLYYPDTLFPLNWDLLKEKRCPICGNKLTIPLKRDRAICRGQKHPRPFIIKKSKLQNL